MKIMIKNDDDNNQVLLILIISITMENMADGSATVGLRHNTTMPYIVKPVYNDHLMG